MFGGRKMRLREKLIKEDKLRQTVRNSEPGQIIVYDGSEEESAIIREEIEKIDKGKAPLQSTNPKDKIGIKKPRLSLVPPSSLIYQALAMQDGANKYGPYNWRAKKVSASVYIDACLRHILDWVDGEEFSSDANVPHLGHALACLGIIVDALETGNLVDDRPTSGSASKLIEKFTKKETK